MAREGVEDRRHVPPSRPLADEQEERAPVQSRGAPRRDDLGSVGRERAEPRLWAGKRDRDAIRGEPVDANHVAAR